MIKKLSSNPYLLFLKAYVFSLAIFTISRFGLFIWKFDQAVETKSILEIFLNGFRVDLMITGQFMLIPFLFFPLIYISNHLQKAYQKLLQFWVYIALLIFFLIEATSPTFIAEYNTRPNILFIEYLKYPKEIIEMLGKGFLFDVILVLGALIGASIILKKLIFQNNLIIYKKIHLLIWPIILIFMFISIRSTFGHRPANPAYFAITQDNLINSIILNSPYSVSYALYSMRHEKDASTIYGKLSDEQILSLTNHSGPKENPTLRELNPTFKGKPQNVVIILEESLGATFVKSLGGLPVTPNLEKLKSDGIWFENLYATGTRSARGIEAVVAGFPPTPAQSTVKLPLSQSNFFTLATLFKKLNYETSFIYGGQAHFDNMRNFFMGNGFEKIVEQKDFMNPKFVGSWGASDQDLFNEAHNLFETNTKNNKPFFSLVFTSSNHAPFEFPDNVIELYEEPKQSENNAVKYADFALGEFINKAKKSNYWNNTVFLIVADHDIRLRGADLIPVNNFHIPGLIVGGSIKPDIIKNIVSQIDLPVTLLSLAGIKASTPLIGNDIMQMKNDCSGRALLQYYDNFGWLDCHRLLILKPNQEIYSGTYDFKNKQSVETKNNLSQNEIDQLLAHALLPTLLYKNQLYKLPE